jgi:hypothetical protein
MDMQRRPPVTYAAETQRPEYSAEARPSGNTRSPQQVREQQRADAERMRQARTASPGTAALVASARPPAPPVASAPPAAQPAQPAVPAAAAAAKAVTVPDTRDYRRRYLDEIAPSSIVGRLIKFSKEGQFVTADDGEAIDESAEFIALCDETLIGWIKFNGPDAPPDRHQGLLYDGYEMPPRESLGDLDQATWELGLSGAPQDPWQHQMCLVLQHCDTRELFTFSTQSVSGRRAVGNLLRHYDRMQRSGSGELPVVRLRAGGFNHRDDRIGWVPVPVFVVVGRAPRDSAQRPDTSPAADLNDAIPW